MSFITLHTKTYIANIISALFLHQWVAYRVLSHSLKARIVSICSRTLGMVLSKVLLSLVTNKVLAVILGHSPG